MAGDLYNEICRQLFFYLLGDVLPKSYCLVLFHIGPVLLGSRRKALLKLIFYDMAFCFVLAGELLTVRRANDFPLRLSRCQHVPEDGDPISGCRS